MLALFAVLISVILITPCTVTVRCILSVDNFKPLIQRLYIPKNVILQGCVEMCMFYILIQKKWQVLLLYWGGAWHYWAVLLSLTEELTSCSSLGIMLQTSVAIWSHCGRKRYLS